MARTARAGCAVLLLAAGCADEVLLQRLEEPQANEVLLALADAGVAARRTPPEGEEGGIAIAVRPAEAAHARAVLSARDLPRPRAPGFSELFGNPGLVPTPLEEHARYLHALSGELSRTIEGIDGVASARVHVALPAPDPLRPDGRRAPRASVLVKCRPEARPRLEENTEGLRRLVAGAADGLDPASVAVVLTEGPPPPSRAVARSGSRGWLVGAALALALALAGGALAAGRRRGDER